MQRLRAVLQFVLWEFGPLIVLLALSAAFGLKAAIAGTVAFIIVDAARRIWWHIPVTRIYLLSSSLALIFGGIDLYSQTPFMLKYEAVITNIATGSRLRRRRRRRQADAAGNRRAAQRSVSRSRRRASLLSALHAGLGWVFLCQSGDLSLAWLGPASGPRDVGSLGFRQSQSGGNGGRQHDAGSSAVFSLPPAGSFADRRRTATELTPRWSETHPLLSLRTQ